jgi:hypothetical protein
VSRDENVFESPKNQNSLFAQALMGFTFFSCHYGKKIPKKVSACFYEIKTLPVILFRYSEGAIFTMKTLTGTRLCGLKYHTGSRL